MTALEGLRARIKARQRDPKVQMLGVGQDLALLEAAIAELALTQQQLARVILELGGELELGRCGLPPLIASETRAALEAIASGRNQVGG